jgi:hypothetical protein
MECQTRIQPKLFLGLLYFRCHLMLSNSLIFALIISAISLADKQTIVEAFKKVDFVKHFSITRKRSWMLLTKHPIENEQIRNMLEVNIFLLIARC